MPPCDFSVLKIFGRETHHLNAHAEPDVKQLTGFHFASKFTQIEPSGSLRLGKYSRSVTATVKTEDIAELKEMLQVGFDRVRKSF